MHFAPCKTRRVCQILHFSGGQQPYTQPCHGVTTTKAAQLISRDALYLPSTPVKQSFLLIKLLQRGLPNNPRESCPSWASIYEKRIHNSSNSLKPQANSGSSFPFLPKQRREHKSCHNQSRQSGKTQTHDKKFKKWETEEMSKLEVTCTSSIFRKCRVLCPFLLKIRDWAFKCPIRTDVFLYMTHQSAALFVLSCPLQKKQQSTFIVLGNWWVKKTKSSLVRQADLLCNI